MKLTRERVIEEARALVNEEGLDALTTRQLGARLNVKGPSLYKHVKSKQEIVDALGTTFFTGTSEPGPEDTWQSWLTERAMLTRKAILACRDGARIVAMARPNLASSGRLDRLLEPLLVAGFDRKEAILASHIVGRLVIGWTLSEQEHGGQIPPASENIDPDAAFDFAIKSVIAGLEMQLIAKNIVGGRAS